MAEGLSKIARAIARYASAVFVFGIFVARMLEVVFVPKLPAHEFFIAAVILGCAVIWTLICQRRVTAEIVALGYVKTRGMNFREHLSSAGALIHVQQAFLIFLPLGMGLGALHLMWQHAVAGGAGSTGGIADIAGVAIFIVAVIVGLCIAQYWAHHRASTIGQKG